MSDRFPLLVIGGLALLAVLAVNLLQGAARGSFADTLSTYRSEPDGARALYLLAEDKHLQVARLQTDLQAIDEHQNLMLLGVQFAEGSSEEEENQSFWGLSLDGGTAADDDADDEEPKLHKGLNQVHAGSVSSSERERLLEHVRSGATLVYVPWGHHENPLLKALDVHLWRADPKLGARTLVPAQPSEWTAGVERVEATVHSYLDLPGGALPILLDEGLGEYVAGAIQYGQGTVVVIGAPALAMNEHLAVADNAQFWLSVVRAAARTAPLGFDEYHHGFTNDRSMADFAKRYGLQFAALQIILGAALWAGSLRRFGRPKKPPEDVRVGATDALFATSRLYREGRHFAHGAQVIVKQLTSELAPLAGLPAKAEPPQVVAALQQRERLELAAALSEAHYRSLRARSDADVALVASKAAAVRRQLQLRTRYRQSAAASHAASPADPGTH